MSVKTLYICYFGVREPLVQTQVIPYLRELARGLDAGAGGSGDFTVTVSLVTFEPEKIGRSEESAIRAGLASQGIQWYCLRYHKRPSAIATAYDILAGAWFVRRKIRDENIDILHGRVHIGTLIGAIARKFSRDRPKLLFDIRGFFPEEYTDAGVWPEGGWLFRTAKRVEKWLLIESDGFVVLTEKAREVLFPESVNTGFDKLGRPVEVIPCCVDFDARFSGDSGRFDSRRKLGLEDRFVVVHLGALGGLYLTNEIVDLLSFCRLRDERTFAMLLTQSDPAGITRLLREGGFTDADFLVRKVDPLAVPEYLSAADVALSFVKSSFSTLSRSPTKIPEYLACGLPVIANAGVGDVDLLVSGERVGAIIDSFTEQSYTRALNEINELRKAGDLEKRCRDTAIKGFDLREVGWKRYSRLYRRLLTGGK